MTKNQIVNKCTGRLQISKNEISANEEFKNEDKAIHFFFEIKDIIVPRRSPNQFEGRVWKRRPVWWENESLILYQYNAPVH